MVQLDHDSLPFLSLDWGHGLGAMASCKMRRCKCLPPSTGEVAGLALDCRQPASSLAAAREVFHAVPWGTSHYRFVVLGENVCALTPSLTHSLTHAPLGLPREWHGSRVGAPAWSACYTWKSHLSKHLLPHGGEKLQAISNFEGFNARRGQSWLVCPALGTGCSQTHTFPWVCQSVARHRKVSLFALLP